MTEVREQPFERVALASFQPDKRRAAMQLGRAVVKALAKVKVRDGTLVVQLDELLDGGDDPFASVPFLPSEPVTLCLTGTARLVADVAARLASASTARFARAKPSGPLGMLRVAAFARGVRIVVDENRELAGAAAALARAGWNAVPATDEAEVELLAAEQLLAGAEAKSVTREASGTAAGPGSAEGEPRRAREKTTRPPCPLCGSKKVVPIRYGYPSPEMEAAAMAGNLRLGGCLVTPGQPEWACRACEHTWAVEESPGPRRARRRARRRGE